MAQSPRVRDSSSSRARIMAAATRLFANHGFHGVTTRQLAAAVNLNVATVHHHVGPKRELYERVFMEMQEQENAMVNEFLEELERLSMTDTNTLRELFNGLIDRMVDMLCANPARSRLYVRRWLDKPPPADSEEGGQSLVLFNSLRRALEEMRARGLIRPGIDLGLFLRSFDWMAYGYFVGGPVGGSRWREDPQKSEHVRAFKAFLHDYLCCMLGL